jgi:5-methylcytosine-specific restriction endonuclease McrA
MEAASSRLGGAPPRAEPCLAPATPAAPPEPCTPAELRALVYAGETDSDACERLLAQVARVEGALDLEIGDGLAALSLGDRLIRLGFSSLGDYAREVLDIEERTAQAMAHLSRELCSRPLLRAAVRAGEVRPRNAQTVLPVAVGDAEAEWVERAGVETVRALEKAVRAARADAGSEPDEEWTRFRVRLAPDDRATVDEALAIAGRLLPGSRRPQRLEAMAQEYFADHPVEAGDDGSEQVGGSFRAESDRLERRKAELERDTDRWSFLVPAAPVPAPCGIEEAVSAEEIDLRLRELAARRDAWDRVLGYCAYAVRRTGLWQIAGFATFEHYCAERLGLSPRTVEQRAAVERRIWEVPSLRAARDEGLAYEKVRLLSRLPNHEIAGWIPRARVLTCVSLKGELEEHDEAQMRAARVLRARVPVRIALLLQAAFRAVRAAEGRLLADGTCLVRVARHFIETWKPHVRKARTLSQKVRERDLGRCRVPGCSRRAVHAHHIVSRSRGGSDTAENLVALCGCHHLRGIHGGYIHVRGRAPDDLVWEVGGSPWRDGDFGTRSPGSSTSTGVS